MTAGLCLGSAWMPGGTAAGEFMLAVLPFQAAHSAGPPWVVHASSCMFSWSHVPA